MQYHKIIYAITYKKTSEEELEDEAFKCNDRK